MEQKSPGSARGFQLFENSEFISRWEVKKMIDHYFLRSIPTSARKSDYFALKFKGHDASCYPQRNAAASLKHDMIPFIDSEPPRYPQRNAAASLKPY